MKTSTTSLLISLFALASLSGCNYGSYDYDTVVEDHNQLRTLDGVKLISPEIADGEDPRSFSQDSYELGPQRRLLLRFESLLSESDQIRTEDGKKVELGIGFSDPAQVKPAQPMIQVCPVLSEWSMFCTWNRAHEEGHGHWQTEGGDYDHKNCVSGTVDGNFLVFDVTQWFVVDVRGRSRNLGLIVLSKAHVTIAGDLDQLLAPQLRWQTSTQSTVPVWHDGTH